MKEPCITQGKIDTDGADINVYINRPKVLFGGHKEVVEYAEKETMGLISEIPTNQPLR